MSVAMNEIDLTIEHSLRGKPSMFQPPGLDGWAINFEHYWSGPHCPYHYHPEFELAMTRGTRGKRVVGNVVVPYTGTELCLIGSNLPHTMVADRGPMGKVRPEIAVVHFTRESLGMELLARPELVPVNALLRRAAHAVKFVDRGARPSAAAELMDEVVRAEGDRFRQFLAFLALLGSLANRTDGRTLLAENYSATENERDHAAFAKLLLHLQQHNDQPISLREAARLVGMSVPSFCRFFKRTTHTTFVEYLVGWRIKRACTLLKETEDAILDISLCVGFESLSHFNRQFLRRTGMTPRAFRRLHGG